jgi:hypothetical protein
MFDYFRMPVEKINVSVKFDKYNIFFTSISTYIYGYISLNAFCNEKDFKFLEQVRTDILCPTASARILYCLRDM